MILVTGSAVARADQLEAALALSLEHVHRSRAEPGCLSHAVHIDAENPRRLVFVEEWASMDALQAHFAVPASRQFGKVLAGLSEGAPTLNLYEAQPLPR
ncbi:MAG: antibiotic biosynthesis monooxygenase [Ramlibacter sp.]|nr:antibiotic biosynthesis monooxygenase [Ramlibacter sp.]